VTPLVDLILVVFVLTNLSLLGAKQLGTCIRLTAAQGMLMSVLPVLAAPDGLGLRGLLFAVVIFGLKGIAFPRLLLRTLRTVNIRHEVEPFVGYAASLLVGIALLGMAFWVSSRLVMPLSHPVVSPLLVPIALATILSGLFLIIGRRTALMQVVGYLVMENGIYLFGIAVAEEVPFLVETGILLDIFVAVFVMGIAVFHINRQFDHIDIEKLTSLKD
jgi:hydrogenase-4 component E